MKTASIISEYNPYHNGHAYHVRKTREMTSSDYIISIMSGNFVQRGEPAIYDKYNRARSAALDIDAVFELPVIFSISNAGDFAMGAVSILNSLGCVDSLSFGVETLDMNLFERICSIITDEPSDYKSSLQDYIKEGNSYPLAREKALTDILGDSVKDIISSPNNILALEYMSAIKKINSSIRICPIIRKGSYHNTDEKNGYLSASAIRTLIYDNKDITPHVPSYDQELFKNALPGTSVLDGLLNLRLSELDYDVIYHEMSKDMMNRLKSIPVPTSFSEAVQLLKTKNITYTRSARALMNMILRIKEDDFREITNEGYSHYANLLSFRKESSTLLKTIQDNSEIPIINKKADYTPESHAASLSWEYDKKATDIYNSLCFIETGVRKPKELSSNVSIVL